MEILIGVLCLALGLALGLFLSNRKTQGKKLLEEADYDALLIEKAQALARNTELEKQIDEQKKLFSEIDGKQSVFLEQVTQKVLFQNSEALQEKNQKSLGLILNPLKEKILDFEKKVGDAYSNEARERFALKQEIERVALSNQRMSEEANNLTRALKGDNKAQGNWGELLLESILESVGLRSGEEFTLQARDMKLISEDGRSMRPDVIIHLPEGKHLIIDSKVSLVAFERYVNCEAPEKEKNLKDFLSSVQNHIRELGDKHYQALAQLNSPDFVFLFMPIEAAFLLYLQQDREAFGRAWDKKIVLVGPSTLGPCLRTVASLWKTERQTKNALAIAQQAGALYDKFVGFLEDLTKVGKGLNDAQRNYEDALSKMSTGKGNLIRATERLRELGVKTKKKIAMDSVDLLDDIEADDKSPAN
jgi:DNA recombination protein RmuC